MWRKNNQPYKFSRPEDGNGFADFVSDGTFFLMCVAIATVVVYVLVPILQPEAWAAL